MLAIPADINGNKKVRITSKFQCHCFRSFGVYYSSCSQVSDTKSKMHDKYLGMSVEEFAALGKRYADFQDACNDLEREPVKVFSRLSEKSIAELLLNRAVSQDLEKKKEEDMKKQAQAAQEVKETEEEKPEEKSEDTAEEKTPETEK